MAMDISASVSLSTTDILLLCRKMSRDTALFQFSPHSFVLHLTHNPSLHTCIKFDPCSKSITRLREQTMRFRLVIFDALAQSLKGFASALRSNMFVYEEGVLLMPHIHVYEWGGLYFCTYDYLALQSWYPKTSMKNGFILNLHSLVKLIPVAICR